MGIISAVVIMGFLIWYIKLWATNPQKFEAMHQAIFNPIEQFIVYIAPMLLLFVIGCILAAIAISLYVVWKGRHHLPEILSGTNDDSKK